MDEKARLKIHQYHHLKAQKISMTYVEVQIVWNFCESLREHAMKIINFKKMKLLTKEQQESYENAKHCCICK